MYLERLKKAGTFTRKDVLSGQLLAGQMEVLWFLKLARIATLELLSVATGYRVSYIKRKHLQPLISQFKLVKRIKFKELDSIGTKMSTNLFALSLRGYEKLGMRARKLGWDELLGGKPLSDHIRLIAEILAYFFRHDVYREKAGEEKLVGNEGKWREVLRRVKEKETKEIEMKYGVGYPITESALRQWGQRIAKVPIPDFYFTFDLDHLPGLRPFKNMGLKHESTTIFMEVETGKDVKDAHFDKKLERYEKNSSFFQTYLNINNYAILFIAPNETKKKTLERRLSEAPQRNFVSYPVIVLSKQELIDMLPYNRHYHRPKWD